MGDKNEQKRFKLNVTLFLSIINQKYMHTFQVSEFNIIVLKNMLFLFVFCYFRQFRQFIFCTRTVYLTHCCLVYFSLTLPKPVESFCLKVNCDVSRLPVHDRLRDLVARIIFTSTKTLQYN